MEQQTADQGVLLHGLSHCCCVLQLAGQRDRVCAISVEATQEAALEGMLRKVQDKWIGVELTVKQYKEAKDAYILGSVEDIQAVLEDSLAMMATISSSRFVTGHLSLCHMVCCRMYHPLHVTCWNILAGGVCSAHVILPVLNNSLTLPGAALWLGL